MGEKAGVWVEKSTGPVRLGATVGGTTGARVLGKRVVGWMAEEG